MNILLLGVGGNVTQGILKALRASSLDCKLVGACVSSSSPGLYMCDTAYISPYAADPSFVPWLQEVCLKERIDAVFSGVEEILYVMALHRKHLEQNLQTKFIVSDMKQLRIGTDKLETCLWLQRKGFAYPRFALAEDIEGVNKLAECTNCRLIAKPRRGKGSRGLIRLRTTEDLRQIKNLCDYIIQEEIGTEHEEYTVGCYRDKGGSFISSIIMRRELFAGTTSKAIVTANPVIEQEATALCAAFNPAGPLNIQLRLDSEGRPVCFELNVRFSGSTPMRSYFGFREVEAALREYVLGDDISDCFAVRAGTAFRYWEEIYIDAEMEKMLETRGAMETMPPCGRLSMSSGQLI